jgi:sigma-B regulation protein RsbU (phosphoserine phosphatase)
MCVPLIKQDEILGVIYGDRVSTSTSYASEDIDFFAGIAQQVSIGLVNCRLLDDHQQMIRMSRELELARSIQTGLFPTTLPKRENFEVAAINEPGDRISGDYYDVIERDDGCIWCVVADVTGEGVAAALLMANLQAAVRITLANVNDPSKLLTHWNELVWRNTDSSKFITCLLALIDPNQSTIRFASAGHCEPILLRDSEVGWEVLEVEQGFPLGVVQDAEFPTTMVELGGEPVVLFCYTDGVIEAMNPDLKMLQMDGLIQSLTELGPLAPAHLIKQVRKCVTEFAAGAKQSDDITMLAARIG